MAVNGIGLQMAEASPQPFFDADEGEEVLEDDEARIRCQALRFESDVEAQLGFTSNVGSAMLHLRGLRFAGYVVLGDNYCTRFGDHVSFCYFRFATDSVRLYTRLKNPVCGLSSLAVNISYTLLQSENPVFCAVNTCMGENLCNLQGDNGDDFSSGGAGDDTLWDGTIENTLEGGDDTLEGGEGNDDLWGGAGNDTLNGGAGNDTLWASAGMDTYVFAPGHGNDTIRAGSDLEPLGGWAAVNQVYDLSGFGDAAPTYAQLQAATRVDSGDVVIDLTAFGGGTIRFDGREGFTSSPPLDRVLQPDNFILSGSGTPPPVAPSTPAPVNPTPVANPDTTERGESGNDTINGGDGNDNVSGEGGADALLGGDGNDYIDGGAGNDRLWGQGGNDGIDGGTGDDRIFGEGGNDTIAGGDGEDRILSGDGDDAIDGGDGFDRVWAGTGDDTIHGSAGRNFLSGGEGADSVYGGAGVDIVIAGGGNDVVIGGGGADRIIGGAGNDTIYGGAGRNYLNGSEGDDNIIGGADRDYLDGEGGNDTLYGGGARDVLAGGAGNDSLVGGAEGDTFFGQEGADTFVIEGGRNWIMDFDDADRLAIGMNLSQVQAAATQHGTDLHIDLAGGGDLYLANTTLTDIEADNLVV